MHWLQLGLFFTQSCLGLLSRALGMKSGSDRVLLYGHKLNGNLLALYKYLENRTETGIVPVFLTMDRTYERRLRSEGVRSAWVGGTGGAKLLAGAAALVSDHGLHALQPLQQLYRHFGLRFFDVGHGIPFKGFDADDYKSQHRYDETWVASDLNRELHVQRFGFDPDRVVATGYARTDRLVTKAEDDANLRAMLGLPPTGALILFAPTWKQDAVKRSLYPFGSSEYEFLGALSVLAAKYGASVVLRSHLNSGDVVGQGCLNVYSLPSARYPDAEAVLLACDMLICDWSSIAFDYLLLDKPAFFLDVEPPFRKGFSLGPQYRYGSIVPDLSALLAALEQCLVDRDHYWQVHGPMHGSVKERVYGGLADGRSAARCVQRLMASISSAAATGGSFR